LDCSSGHSIQAGEAQTRAGFCAEARIERLIHRARHRGTAAAMLFVDVNGLKSINDAMTMVPVIEWPLEQSNPAV
jgi:hypothetical protein